MKTLIHLILIFFIGILVTSDAAAQERYSWRDTLDAIRQVETGGLPNDGIGARGDGGAALGPYQIHRVYHIDAAERDSTLSNYQSCLTSKAYSERVMRAYMNRYARAEMRRLLAGEGTIGDVEKVARIHNGGPRGHTKKATKGYWSKVRKLLPCS
jgi:hypothetical protein